MLLEKEITHGDDWTPWKLITDGKNVDVSISGLGYSAVTVQRKDARKGKIIDVDRFDSDIVTYFYVPTRAYYRVEK